MASDMEDALWALEEAIEEVLSFVKGASYGLRLAVKRVSDFAKAPSSASGPPATEMERLIKSLERGEDDLSDLIVLALGDHFRAFLARALALPQLPPLPEAPADVEELAGTPGALATVPFWFPILLQLYRAVLRGGRLDRKALKALGLLDLEIAYPGGKVKLFREGSHVTLTEHHLEAVAEAMLAAARAVRLRLLTA